MENQLDGAQCRVAGQRPGFLVPNTVVSGDIRELSWCGGRLSNDNTEKWVFAQNISGTEPPGIFAR
jgi:hypothetical protein